MNNAELQLNCLLYSQQQASFLFQIARKPYALHGLNAASKGMQLLIASRLNLLTLVLPPLIPQIFKLRCCTSGMSAEFCPCRMVVVCSF